MALGRCCKNLSFQLLLCIFGLLAIAAVSDLQITAKQDWLNHGGNLYNRRYADKENKISRKTASKLRLKWKFYTGSDTTATPAIYDGTLYFPSWNGYLYAVNQSDGRLVWEKNLFELTGINGSNVALNINTTVSRTTPVIADDLLITGLYGPAVVIAVKRSTGKLVWSTQLDDHPAGVITMSGTYFNRGFYIGSSSLEEGQSIDTCCTFRGSLFKLDSRTGKVLWQTHMLPDNFGKLGEYAGAAIWGSSPSIDVRRNHVYIATGNLYSAPLHIRECQERENNQTQPTHPDKCVEPENHSNSILALDLDTGTIKWFRQLGGYDVWFFACNNLSTPDCPPGPNPDADFGEAPMMLSIYVNGTNKDVVVAVQKSGFTWTLDRDNGTLIWSIEAGPGGLAGGGTWGAATDKERVYTNIANSNAKNFTQKPSTEISTAGGWVAMDAGSGKIVWSIADPANATANGPVTVANGVLFGGSTFKDGPLYAIDAKTGSILWSYNTGATIYGGGSVSDGCLTTMSFVPPAPAGPVSSGFRPAPPARFNDPSVPAPPTTYAPPTAGPFQRYPTPQFPSTAQAPPTRAPPVGPPSIQSPASQQPPQVAFHPQQQVTPVPMGSPPLPGYPSKQSNFPSQTSMQSPFPASQGNYAPPPPTSSPFPPPQGGFVSPAMQHAGYAPPVNSIQSLTEDFSSLSVGSIPGSMEPAIDPKALPRPLDGDVEPKSFAEMYPMNCNSRFLRLTTAAIPNSQSLVSRWHLPLGAVVCPLAEAPEGDEVPVLNFASTGIIRCRRCRTYVNPYVTFTDSGRKWRCNICSLLNDVPGDYFAHLDANGRRIDFDQRPELTKGSVEFIAPTEYMVRPPMPPLFFFLIDVSISAIRSGMVEVVAQTIRSCLDELPGFPRTQIGFITYDSTIHFYNMKSSLTQPQMMVVSDLDDIFVPLPDDLLVNLSESRSVVETFLETLPTMFQDNVNVESAFGPALKAAFMVMSQLGGKLLIFQNTLPSLGVGRLKLRGDDLRVYGTDKEHTLRVPEDPFYKQMAADFTKLQIGVHVYAFSDKYTDIASIGTLAKYTGGQVYYYPGFQSIIHGEKLRHELARDLTRETAWEAVMRIRCGKGIRFTSYHGNFMLRSTDLLALPAVDCDKAYAMQLSLEETLLTTQTVYFQVALLYTASCGERRIRVHTAAASVVSDLGEMYRQADTGAIVSLFARLAIEKTLSSKLEDARNSVQIRIVKALREYRNLYAVQHRLGARMIFPESLKFLAVYGLALCKSTPLRGGYAEAQLDERCAAGYTMMALPVKELLKLLYPSLIRVDEYLLKSSGKDNDFKENLKRLPLTADSLDSRGLYIYDDGFRFIMWFGRTLSPGISESLLGGDFAAELSRVTLREHDNEMSRKLMGILKRIRESDPSYYKLTYLVRQGEQPREGLLLLTNLVEDQFGGVSGYVDWIMQIHRQVQQNA